MDSRSALHKAWRAARRPIAWFNRILIEGDASQDLVFHAPPPAGTDDVKRRIAEARKANVRK
jgi:hypothetical protein